MSNIEPAAIPIPVESPLFLKDLAALLVRHYGLKDGTYEPMVEFMIGTGNMGPSPDTIVPSAIIGVSKVGLVKVPNPTPNSVDAAKANPQKPPRARRTKSNE
jgi:hypothetical protein